MHPFAENAYNILPFYEKIYTHKCVMIFTPESLPSSIGIGWLFGIHFSNNFSILFVRCNIKAFLNPLSRSAEFMEVIDIRSKKIYPQPPSLTPKPAAFPRRQGLEREFSGDPSRMKTTFGTPLAKSGSRFKTRTQKVMRWSNKHWINMAYVMRFTKLATRYNPKERRWLTEKEDVFK